MEEPVMKDTQWLARELKAHGVSRNDFLKFCGSMAAMLSLPEWAAAKLPETLAAAAKPTVVWLEFQDCAGNTESFLRAWRPTVAEIILDAVSVNYHETIMAAAGTQATAALDQTVAKHSGEYLAIVEGAVPTGAGGAYCTIGGKAALEIAREVCGHAAATIAVGTCASFGGLPAALPNPTSALSISEAVPAAANVINLSACPANADNITALLVYYMTMKRWPPLDDHRRPVFAYGQLIHDACERRAHFDNGQYVQAWGDEGHRLGYCLYQMGCKGPVTSHNCPIVKWNEGTNWPVECGHPCVGCAEPQFWDKMSPFYKHLTGVPGFGMAANIDKVGIGAAAVVTAAFVTQGIVQKVRSRKEDNATTQSHEEEKRP
ncbi:MAG: hydrogenase small subunit [Vulcanimicrobiaceae bacterium]